jgi:SAM-dependent methyltransferase
LTPTSSVEPAPREDLWALRALSCARRLCDWTFEQYGGEVWGSVAEVGAGIGTFSERILAAGAESLLAVEPEPAAAAVLEERLGGDPRVTIVREQLPIAPSLSQGAFDLIVCQNVLEHIEDDSAALRTLGAALRPDGRLALLVPAHPRLFSHLDRSFGHYRRYTRAGLTQVVESSGLRIVDLRSFNLLGILGWWAKKVLGSERLGSRSLAAYEVLVRFWRPIEDRLSLPWGLSVVAHAEPRGGPRLRGSQPR